MTEVLNWLVNNIIDQTAIFMAIVAAAGLIVQKKQADEVIEGTLLTAVGYVIFTSANPLIISALSSINGILLPTISTAAGINPNPDYQIAFAASVPWLAANVMIAFVVAWLIHIAVVKIFNKWFKAVYLTVHVQIGWTALLMAIAYCNFKWSAAACYIWTIVLDVIIWTVGPMLTYKEATELSGGAFAMGHYGCFSGGICKVIAPFFGDPEKDDAENLNLPGWLTMFGNNVLANAIVMPILFIIICILVMIIGNTASLEAFEEATGDTNWIVWCILTAFQFAAGCAILMQGLRMFLGSIIPAFQGFTEKLLPGVIPAIDYVAFFGYAPMSVLFGFVGFLAAAFISAIINAATGVFPAFVYPEVALSFFNGGALGIFSNQKGGWKAALILPFIFGLIMHLGSGLLAAYMPDMTAMNFGIGSTDPVIIAGIILLIFGKK
ncbi:MAG: PTS transporter subunit IIC [Eubacteriales bacterium]|nr:PTS transporter subunit IIC [Eubacteriales bacterium]